MKSVRFSLAAIAMIAMAAQGCEDQSSPAQLPDGTRTISKNMRGSWHAPGGAHCVWYKRTKDGVVTARGASRKSQTVAFYTADVTSKSKFYSDRCGPWKKR